MPLSPEEEARDRNTSKNRLEQLAYHQSLNVRQAVAQNPNTGITELGQLFYYCPDLVLYNPAFEENPALLEQLCDEISSNIFSLPQPLPLYIQNWALNHQNRYIRQYLACSSVSVNSYLEKLAEDETVEVRIAVARNHQTPQNILSKLAKDTSFEVCAAVAQNPVVSEAILNELAQHKNILVRRAVAINPLISSTLKEQLATDEVSVRVALLTNPSISSDLLDRLVEDDNEEVRIALASNINLPSNILEKLIKDESRSVRLALLKNPHLPSQILEQLQETEPNPDEITQKAFIRQYYENKLWKISDRIGHIRHFIKNFPDNGRIIAHLKIRSGECYCFGGVTLQKISETVPETVAKTFERHLWYSQYNLSHVYVAKIPVNGIDSFAILIDGYSDDGWDNCSELIEIFDSQGNPIGAINLSQDFIMEIENELQDVDELKWFDRQLDGSDYGYQDFFYPGDFPNIELKNPGEPMWSLNDIKDGYCDPNSRRYSSDTYDPSPTDIDDIDNIPFLKPIYHHDELVDSWEQEVNRYWEGPIDKPGYSI